MISRTDFLSTLQNALELERELRMEDDFRDYDEWDSLTFLSLVTVLRDEFALTLSADDFNNIDTWEDIFARIK